MKTYKPKILGSMISLITDLIGIAFCSLLVFVIVCYFIKGHELLLLGIIILFFILSFVLLISSKLVKFTLDLDGHFCYYHKGKQKYDIDLSSTSISYKETRTNWFVSGLDLYIITSDDKLEIDCSGLGSNQFYQMFYDMEQYAMNTRKSINDHAN